MKYYPRIVFIDIKDESKRKNYIKQINSLCVNFPVKEYLKIVEIKEKNNFGNLNTIMRGLKGCQDIQLPGDASGEKFNFINIIFTDMSNENQITELLNNVYEATKFEEMGNVNLYVLVTNNIYNFSTNIPIGSLGQVIIQNKYEDGTTINDDEYNNLTINLLISLIIIPERQQFIDYIFFSNPGNKVTIFSKLFTYPNEGHLEKIKEILISKALIEINSEGAANQNNFDTILSDDLFQKLEINLKDNLFFKNKPKIKIPFFTGRNKRNKHVKSFYNKYDGNRRDTLKQEIDKITIERNNIPLIQWIKRIDENVHFKVIELLSQRFSFGSVKKALEEKKTSITKNINEFNKLGHWYFLQELKIPNIDGRPFEKVYLISSFIVLFVCIGLLLVNPYYSLALFVLVAVIFISIGLFYLKDINRSINNTISIDIDTIKSFIEKNPQQFISSLKRYIKTRIIKVLDNNISIIDSVLKRFEKVVDSYKVKNEIKTIDGKIFNDIETEIMNSINELITKTLNQNKQEILSNYKEPDIFIYYLLDTFSRSDCFKQIRERLFGLQKQEIELSLNIEPKLPVSSEINGTIIRITKKRGIFIANIHHQNNIDQIPSVDDFTISILSIGVING